MLEILSTLHAASAAAVTHLVTDGAAFSCALLLVLDATAADASSESVTTILHNAEVR